MAAAEIRPTSFITVGGAPVIDVFIVRLNRVPAESPEDQIAYKVAYRTEPNAKEQIAWVDMFTYNTLHDYTVQVAAAINAEADALE